MPCARSQRLVVARVAGASAREIHEEFDTDQGGGAAGAQSPAWGAGGSCAGVQHDARFTRAFEEQVAWLAVQTCKQAVCELMRISWDTVGAILTRVQRRLDHGTDRVRGVRRIGIDEIFYRRGQRYLTVVLDHDSGRLLWAAEGRHEATLHSFFDAVGAKGCGQITHVS